MHSPSLQAVFRYASPVLVAAESIQRLELSKEARTILFGTAWWSLLVSTRILLAHASMAMDTQRMRVTIALNLRALLRLVGIDISEKEALVSLATTDTVWYRDAHADNGNVWLSFRKGEDVILQELKKGEFEDIKSSFDGMLELTTDEATKKHLCHARTVFGHAVYKLVATSWTTWAKNAKEFSKSPNI